METTANKNTATLLQLSAFTQYFFPLGNFIFPAVIWSLKRNDSHFVDYNGRQAINFQLSMLLYTLLLFGVSVPAILYAIFNGVSWEVLESENWEFSIGKITGIAAIGIITGLVLVSLKVAEFILILYASVKNSNGENYRFPLTINFIK